MLTPPARPAWADGNGGRRAIRPFAIITETLAVLREVAAAPALRNAALFLLPYAGVLIGLDVAAHYGALTDAALPAQFYLASDWGFGEWLEYSLTFAVAAMLLAMWWWQSAKIYLANAALFVWMTLDNSIEVHERFGHALAPLFAHWQLPVRANDVGEAALFAAIGGVWLVTLWFGVRSARPRPAIESAILAGCIVVAAFFGVIVDLVVVWGPHNQATIEVETFIEDGGEFAMICIAFLIQVALFDRALDRARRLRATACDALANPANQAAKANPANQVTKRSPTSSSDNAHRSSAAAGSIA